MHIFWLLKTLSSDPAEMSHCIPPVQMCGFWVSAPLRVRHTLLTMEGRRRLSATFCTALAHVLHLFSYRSAVSYSLLLFLLFRDLSILSDLPGLCPCFSMDICALQAVSRLGSQPQCNIMAQLQKGPGVSP